MSEYSLYIDGDLVSSDRYYDVINPATEEIVAQAPYASSAQVDAAIQAAHKAFPSWTKDESSRSVALKLAAEAIRKRSEDIAKLITLEQGRPIHFAIGEVAGAAATLEHYANFDLPPLLPLRSDSEKFVAIERRALGVVAAITPWNVPIILLILKVAPALKAGNTVVIKPSEFTPLSTLLLGEVLNGIFPAGVLNIISGDGEVGAQLSQHHLVKKITFTGSVATGKKLYAGAASDVKRLTLELGGNDAAIVLDDADPKTIVEKIFWGAFWNSGQICFAIKRVYVHERIFPQLLEALIERAKAAKVGNGFEQDVELGPITNAIQFEKVKYFVADALKHGAKIHTGGAALAGPGYFYPPTIVTGVGEGVALVDEEQFGPVLPIIPFSDEKDAIRQANASPFGLGASVWTADAQRGLAVVRQLDVGLAWVNQHGDIHPGAPKGGFKWSGLGYEGGLRGYEEFSELQVVNAALN